VEADGRVLIIKRIHVDYKLKAEPSAREAAERVHGMHADFCPVARTLKGCVEITTKLHIEES
jgi:uncharacterized OsmC-like protein